MISIILPYSSQKMLDKLREMKVEKEIIVPETIYKNHDELKKIKANNLEEFIIRGIENCNGEEILFLGGLTDKKTLEKMVHEIKNADIVYLKRRKHSFLAKFFIHLILPKSRIFSDPLTQIFIIKKNVIEGIEFKPVEKILIEIIAKGNYKKIKEISSDAKISFNKDYKNYSSYLFKLAWKEGEILRFTKFGIVGASSVFVNEFILWIFLKFGVLIAGFLGIESSILYAFILNDLWTFKDRGKKKLKPFFKRMGKYNAFSFIALLINLSVLFFLTKFFGLHPLISNIFGMACAFIWNFLTNNFLIWSI